MKSLLRILACIMIAAFFIPLVAFSEGNNQSLVAEGSCGNQMTWALYETTTGSSYSLRITGSGRMSDWNENQSPWNAYKSGITSIAIDNGVTSIGDNAFYDCFSLISVSLPQSLTSLGRGSFAYCSKLTTISLPDNITNIGYGAFQGCGLLESVVLPTQLTSLSGQTFGGCTKLSNVSIPNGVTGIGGFCFSNCRALTSIILPESITSIDWYAFYDTGITTISIPKNVSSIGTHAFEVSYSLASINVDQSNQYYCSVDGVLFSKDKSILCFYPLGKTGDSYTIPHSVKKLADNSFYENHTLKSLIFPDGLQSIGTNVFWGCTLKSIDLPDSLTEIGECCFSNCSYLSVLRIPGGVETIESGTCMTSNVGTIILEEGVKYIKSSAFAYSNATITLPSTIREIGTDAIGQEANILCHHDTYAETWASEHGNNITYTCNIVPSAQPATASLNGYVGNICNVCGYHENPVVTIHSNSIIFIPNGTKRIESEGFSGVTAEQINLPAELSSVDNKAFSNNAHLLLVIIPGMDTTIAPDAFNESPNVTLLCPAGSNAAQYAETYNIPHIVLE